MDDPLLGLLDLPGVAEAVESARSSVDALLWDRAVGRAQQEVTAESALRGAWANAWFDGAEAGLPEMRSGAALDSSPIGRVLSGVVAMHAELPSLVAIVGTAPGAGPGADARDRRQRLRAGRRARAAPVGGGRRRSAAPGWRRELRGGRRAAVGPQPGAGRLDRARHPRRGRGARRDRVHAALRLGIRARGPRAAPVAAGPARGRPGDARCARGGPEGGRAARVRPRGARPTPRGRRRAWPRWSGSWRQRWSSARSSRRPGSREPEGRGRSVSARGPRAAFETP